MSGWLISIVGVVSLGVLIEVLLPEGENSKYIRGIFSIIVIFVIISPLPKLAKGDYVKGFETSTQEIAIDGDYYDAVKEDIQERLADNLQKKLEKAGYNDLSYDIQFDEQYVYIIDNIKIYANDMSDSQWQELLKYLQTAIGGVKIERV